MTARIRKNPNLQLSHHPKSDEALMLLHIYFKSPVICFMHCIHYMCIYSFLHLRLTRNTTIAARERLTIYFHAVLSKDFKFDPNEDRIFIQAGHRIGKWDDNIVELSATRYLFLNEVNIIQMEAMCMGKRNIDT